MHSASKEYIKQLLDSQEPMEPIATHVDAVIQPMEGIKAVLFDIYGTMLISSSGDIDQAEISVTNLKRALDASEIKILQDTDSTLDHILKDFEYTINVCHDAARRNKVPYPEIDVLSIWRIVLTHARRKKLVTFSEDADIMLMTCVFEFLSNRVYPMPGLKETIKAIKKTEMPIGIVSNAQFYTPVLMNYFLHNKISLKNYVKGFDNELSIFSYKFGIGKPDPKLYEELIPTLKWKYGIIPSEVLFVGNDMLKDVYAAGKAGFKTVLFAGDKRSLRLRTDDDRTKNLKPDLIITELNHMLKILK